MKVNLALEKFKDGASPGGLGSLEAPSTHVHRRSQSTVPISSASGSLQLHRGRDDPSVKSASKAASLHSGLAVQ